MSGVNPQGFRSLVLNIQALKNWRHDFLWRTTRCLPERGRIGIFNVPTMKKYDRACASPDPSRGEYPSGALGNKTFGSSGIIP